VKKKMAANSETLQLIGRLTPLAEVLGLIDAEVKPVTPRTLDVAQAAGRTLAVDAAAPVRPAAAPAEPRRTMLARVAGS
jgi:hypothetical protein